MGASSIPEPLDAEELIRLADALKNNPAFQNTQRRVENRRALRRRAAEVNISGISEKLEGRTPSLEIHEDRYSNRLRSADIVIEVAAKKADTGLAEKAQDIKNFLYALYHDLRRKRTSRFRAPDDRAIRYQVSDYVGIRHLDWSRDVHRKLYGEGGGKIEDIAAALKKVMKDGFQGNPFELRAPDCLRVYWDEDGSMVAEIGTVSVSKLRATYPEHETTFDDITSVLRAEDAPSSDNTAIPFYHVETPGFIYEAISVMGKEGNAEHLLLRSQPNAAGRPRYTFAPGHESTGDEPWQYFRPLLAPLYPLAEQINILDTLLLSSALQTGRAPYQRVKVGSQADDFGSFLARPDNDQNVVWLDKSNPVWPDAGPGNEWKPVPAPDLQVLLIVYQQKVIEFQQAGFPSILSPDAQIDASSGYDRSRQMEGAQDFLSPPLENIAAAWHELFMIALDQLETVGLPVTMSVKRIAQGEDARVRPQVTIDPKDLTKDFDLEVKLLSIPKVVQFAEDESDRRDVDLGFLAESSYMKRRFDDAAREMRQVNLDRVGRAAAELANDFSIQYLKTVAPDIAQRIAAEQAIPIPAEGNGFKPARPAGGSVPGLGVDDVPKVQSQTGSPPAVDGGATGTAQ